MYKKILLSVWIVFIIVITLFAGTNYKNQQEKMLIAVLELDAAGITPEEGKILTDRLRYELFETGKFAVLERSKMEEILKEQSFQLSGCTSNECLVEVGRLIGVQAMAGGSVGKIGNLYTMNVRLIDVETAAVLKNAVVDYKGTLDGLLTTGIRKVARKLAGLDESKNTVVEQTPTESTKPVEKKQIASNKSQTTKPIRKKKKVRKFKRWDLDFGYGRADVTFEARSADGTLIAKKSYGASNIYISAKYNMTRNMGFLIGISGGSHIESNLTNIGELESVDFTSFILGFEYRVFRLASLGLGFHSTTTELGFKGFDQTISYTQKGIYFRGGFYLPLTSFLQFDFYAHGGSGTKPALSYYTFGLDFRL